MARMLTRRSLGIGAATLATLRAGAAKATGSAILVIDADPPTLNLAMTTDYAAGDVAAKIMEGLVWIDREYRPQPSLATAWDVSPDGLSYTFHLRQGVTWHDGMPFTAGDVVFTFQQVLLKYHPRSAAMLKRVGAQLEAPDPATVVIRLEHPYAPFLQQLTVFDAPILPRHVYEGTDIPANPANQHPIGTGPFTFASWERGSTIHLSRNAKYWAAPKPLLDGLIFQIIPQPANRGNAVQSGDADEVVDFYMPKPDEVRLLKDASLQHREGVNIPAIYFLVFNITRAPFDKPTARQAVAMALDRPRMVAQAMRGLATPGAGAFGDGFGWLNDPTAGYAKLYPMDPAKARSLLGPVSETPHLLYDAARPQMIATAQIVRENLHAIGLEIVLEPLERSVLNDKVFAKRDFDMTLQSYFSAGDPAIGYHRLYLTENGRAQLTNPSGYSNPEIDRLLGEAATAPNRDRRATLYRQAEAILDVDLPSIVLFDEKTADFATKKLTGLWPALDPRDQWAGVAMAG
jgi:peptide/nickel transport system substrate-binding protein